MPARSQLIFDIGYVGTHYNGWQSQTPSAPASHKRVLLTDGAATFDPSRICFLFNKRRGCLKKECFLRHVCSRCEATDGHIGPDCRGTEMEQGLPSLHDVVEPWVAEGVKEVLRCRASGVVAASRTDRGVHARSALIWVNVWAREDQIGASKLQELYDFLLPRLPRDVMLNQPPTVISEEQFNGGRALGLKTYRYFLLLSRIGAREPSDAQAEILERLVQDGLICKLPDNVKVSEVMEQMQMRRLSSSFLSEFATDSAILYARTLDLAKIHGAAEENLLGRQDFSRFSTRCDNSDSVRTLQRVDVVERDIFDVYEELTARGCANPQSNNLDQASDTLVQFVFTADGFLRHMVRRLVGYLLTVGLTLELRDVSGESRDVPFDQDLIEAFVHAAVKQDERNADDADGLNPEALLASRRGERDFLKPKRAPPQGLWLWGRENIEA